MTNKTGEKNKLSPDERREVAERAAFEVPQNEAAYRLLADETGISLGMVYKLRKMARGVSEAQVAEARKNYEWTRRMWEMYED